MHSVSKIIPASVIEAIGWTLFHSVWQFAIIALVLLGILLVLKNTSARSRYIIAFISLVLLLICSSVTFVRSYRYAEEKALMKENFKSNPQILVQSIKKNLQSANIRENKSALPVKWKLKWIILKSHLQKYFSLTVGLWLLCVIFLVVKIFIGLYYSYRLKKQHIFNIETYWINKVHEFAQRLNIKRNVGIFKSFRITMPMTIGYLKPVILMPVSALSGIPVDQLETIIAHEMAHIARADYLFNIIQSFIRILFFYHPAVWWISYVIRNEREHSCDDIAVELTGSSLQYARALATIQEQTMAKSQFAMHLSTGNHLFKRIQRILNQTKMRTNFNEGLIASCIISVGLLFMAFSMNATADKSYMQQKKQTNVQNDSAYTSELPDSVNQIEGVTVYADSDSSEENVSEAEYYDQVGDMLEGLENLGNITPELQKQLEIAFSLSDSELNREVLQAVQAALSEMDIDLIVDEAMKGAQAAIDNMDLNVIVNEAMADGQNQPQDVDLIVSEAIKGASAALDEMDINLIVNEAMKGVQAALSEMDIDAVVQAAVDNELSNISVPKCPDNPNKVKMKSKNNYEKYLREGSENWNNWRKENKDKVPNLNGANINGVNLREANLDRMVLSGANFNNCDLSDASLAESEAKGVNFLKCIFIDTQMRRTRLKGCTFTGNNMQNCDFRDADLHGVVFTGNTIGHCDFRNANLRGTVFTNTNLDRCKFKGAVADSSTLFPKNFDPQKHGIILK